MMQTKTGYDARRREDLQMRLTWASENNRGSVESHESPWRSAMLSARDADALGLLVPMHLFL
jgi:hypothetical protein